MKRDGQLSVGRGQASKIVEKGGQQDQIGMSRHESRGVEQNITGLEPAVLLRHLCSFPLFTFAEVKLGEDAELHV